jgi:hypothetical protein
MSLNIKTGAYWERSEQKEEDDPNFGESKLFLNRHANRDFKINEIVRKKAYKEFLEQEKKAKESGDAGEDTKDGDGANDEEEKEIVQELVVEEEEDEATKRKRRKVFNFSFKYFFTRVFNSITTKNLYKFTRGFFKNKLVVKALNRLFF